MIINQNLLHYHIWGEIFFDTHCTNDIVVCFHTHSPTLFYPAKTRLPNSYTKIQKPSANLPDGIKLEINE